MLDPTTYPEKGNGKNKNKIQPDVQYRLTVVDNGLGWNHINCEAAGPADRPATYAELITMLHFFLTKLFHFTFCGLQNEKFSSSFYSSID